MSDLTTTMTIPLKGGREAVGPFVFEIGGSFFEAFGNGRILDADCTVKAEVSRKGTLMWVHVSAAGFVVVECDRCLEPLPLKVAMDRVLTVGFGALDGDDATQEEDTVVVSASDGELDISQFVYDYICLGMPVVMVHPEGGCNPDMTARLSADPGNESAEGAHTPFSGLKEIMNDKQNK